MGGRAHKHISFGVSVKTSGCALASWEKANRER
jgi:hypothetical protein